MKVVQVDVFALPGSKAFRDWRVSFGLSLELENFKPICYVGVNFQFTEVAFLQSWDFELDSELDFRVRIFLARFFWRYFQHLFSGLPSLS